MRSHLTRDVVVLYIFKESSRLKEISRSARENNHNTYSQFHDYRIIMFHSYWPQWRTLIILMARVRIHTMPFTQRQCLTQDRWTRRTRRLARDRWNQHLIRDDDIDLCLDLILYRVRRRLRIEFSHNPSFSQYFDAIQHTNIVHFCQLIYNYIVVF